MNIRLAQDKDKKEVLQLLDDLLVDDAIKRGIKPGHIPVVEAGKCSANF